MFDIANKMGSRCAQNSVFVYRQHLRNIMLAPLLRQLNTRREFDDVKTTQWVKKQKIV